MNESGFNIDVGFYRTLMFRSTILLALFMGMVSGKVTKGSIAGSVPNVFLLLVVGYVLSRGLL